MEPFIVAYGKFRDITYAASLADALEKARAFALAEGMSAEEAGDPEEVWAERYDFHRARDLNLTWLDERERGWDVKEARP